jgi:malic enzyme
MLISSEVTEPFSRKAMTQNHTAPTGVELLRDARRTKGSAFSPEERRAHGLRGLLPPGVRSLEAQLALELERVRAHADPLDRYLELDSLLNRSEVLFYRLLVENMRELLPIVYTPTVGEACRQFSRICRQPRGLWITPDDLDCIPQILHSAPDPDVRLIVVTDNERILGLGDLGCGGMGIPVGKLVLYTAAAGINPRHCLPISLDVGTDNPELHADPNYLGLRRPRLRGPEYDRLVDAFVRGVQEVFPEALLQWEDFHKQNSFKLLDRYRKRLPSFNDDIQGTGAMGLAGVLTALRRIGGKLADQRILYAGAGAAAIGIGRMVRLALLEVGVPEADADTLQAFVDTRGLIYEGREVRERHKCPFLFPREALYSLGFPSEGPYDLLETVGRFRPTILIGATAQPGLFTEAVIREMTRHTDQPVIFPLSNPTSKAECSPADALAWTDGRGIIATGSPASAVEWRGETREIGQANNSFIFPGVGLGCLVSQAREVTDSMLLAAARALSDCVGDGRLAAGALYPDAADMRSVSRRVALAVVQEARRLGSGRMMRDGEVAPAVDAAMWWPDYPPSPPTEFSGSARRSP